MRLQPRPILSEEELLRLIDKASPLSTYGKSKFAEYRRLAQGVADAARQGDLKSYKSLAKKLEDVRESLDWLASRRA